MFFSTSMGTLVVQRVTGSPSHIWSLLNQFSRGFSELEGGFNWFMESPLRSWSPWQASRTNRWTDNFSGASDWMSLTHSAISLAFPLLFVQIDRKVRRPHLYHLAVHGKSVAPKDLLGIKAHGARTIPQAAQEHLTCRDFHAQWVGPTLNLGDN